MVPIEDASGLLGSVVLTLPPGRDVRPLEHRLLSDIAEQAALALRNVRLELELAARVRQLDRHTRELAASRNRIIGAVDTERRRLESSIAVRVLPTMLRLRSEVARSATGGAQAERIEECVDLATEALESLRELTRGIYPTILTRSGLGSALTSHAARVRRAATRCGSTRTSRPRGSPSTSRPRRTTAAWRCSSTPAGEIVLTLSDDGERARRVHPRREPGRAQPAGDRRSGRGVRRSARRARTRRRDVLAGQASGSAPALPSRSIRPHLQQACGAEGRLGDVRRRAAPGQVEVVLVVGGEQDDDRRRRDPADLAGSLDAVDARQVDVHQHQVRPELGRRCDRLLARRDGADDGEALGLLHDGRHRTPERVLVVDDQHPDLSTRDRGHAS